MDILQPSFGLFFWYLIIFLAGFFLLKKFAWGPILTSLEERENGIEASLSQAEKARAEMAKLSSDNEALIKEAREERAKIIREAGELKDVILAEAKATAQSEGEKIVTKAREEIQSQKMAALTEIKNQVGKLSIEIAEKLIQKELSADSKKAEYVDGLLADLHVN